MIIVIVIIVIVSAGNSISRNSGQKTAPVGGTIHVLDNLDVTLTDVTLSKGNSIEQPKTGNEYVVAHFRFHNFRSSTTDVASTGFYSESKGVRQDPEFVSSLTKNYLGVAGTSLTPGGNIKRDVVFQISKGDQNAKIVYEPANF